MDESFTSLKKRRARKLTKRKKNEKRNSYKKSPHDKEANGFFSGKTNLFFVGKKHYQCLEHS